RRDADVAMYVAKGEGKDRFRLFDPGMHASILERMELEASLRRAVERDELVLHYQPIVALLTGRAVGFEALARWQHPERGLLLPAEFIPVAERTGQAVVMGRWVLHEACRQAACWRRFRGEDGSPLAMSVNLSAAQLHHPDFVEQVASALFEHDLEPGSVILEITESTMVEDLDDAVQAAALIAEGCLLGQGYHYARPAPATEIEALLGRSRRLPLGA